MSIIDLIPTPYKIPSVMFFAAFPWIVVAIIAYKAWRISVRKRHAQMAYRALEERCRAIVDLAAVTWPDLVQLRGEDYLRGLEGKLRAVKFLFDSIEEVPKLDLPPHIRWYVRQVQSIKHHLREHDYPDDGNPAGAILGILSNDRTIALTAQVVRMRRGFKLNPAYEKASHELDPATGILRPRNGQSS